MIICCCKSSPIVPLDTEVDKPVTGPQFPSHKTVRFSLTPKAVDEEGKKSKFFEFYRERRFTFFKYETDGENYGK